MNVFLEVQVLLYVRQNLAGFLGLDFFTVQE